MAVLAYSIQFPLTADQISLGNALMHGALLPVVSFSPKEYLFLESNKHKPCQHEHLYLPSYKENCTIPFTVLFSSAAKCGRPHCVKHIIGLLTKLYLSQTLQRVCILGLCFPVVFMSSGSP